MAVLGVAAWASFCTVVMYSVFKLLDLPKRLVWGVSWAILSFAVPVFSFWGNPPTIEAMYGVYFIIMLGSLIVSFLVRGLHRTFFWFFLGVLVLFLVFWTANLLPYRLGWEEGGEATLERFLGAAFHHSTLAPAIASIVLLLRCCCPSSRVFAWLSRHLTAYAFLLGILAFAIASQIPEILKYGTPWW